MFLLQHRMKRKRKRSNSSSTSSSSSSTSEEDSPSTRHKKSKKRKRKRRHSSRSSKKHKRRVSSCSDKTAEDEWFPAPANTSASFINQKSITKLIREGEQTFSKGQHEDSGGRLEGSATAGNSDRLSCPGLNGEVRERHMGRKISEERWECSSTSKQARNRRDSSSSSRSEHSHRQSKEFSSQDRRHSESDRGRLERIDKDVRNNQDLVGGRKSEAQNKSLPSNLLDIFSKIAEFEKEKKLKK